MNSIHVNEGLCVSCKTCYRACRTDVIRWDESRELLGHRV
jgi:ferredoxin